MPPVTPGVISMNNTDQIIDEFVISQNRNGGNILKFAGIDWIDPIFKRFPAKYPPSFLSLISRYVFGSFDINEMCLFANRGDNSHDDLSKAVFKDKLIFQTTTGNGFIQFSRPSDGSYDPICFDIRKRKKSGEYKVVRLDHEKILQFEKIKVVKDIAESFIEAINQR
jgi:hypothetical protein